MLRKGVFPYEYMDDWKKLNENLVTEKEDFSSHLNTADITDADYAHAKKVCKNFEMRNLGEYHGFYVQSDTLLFPHVFNFRNMYLEIYELDPAKIFSAPKLAW